MQIKFFDHGSLLNHMNNIEQRGDQMPHVDEDEFNDISSNIINLDNHQRHPFQHTKSTRIPFYYANYVPRG